MSEHDLSDGFRYISENTVGCLSLHDCICTRLHREDRALVFEMEWMEVLPFHPDNHTGQARQSGKGRIVLLDPIILNGTLRKWSTANTVPLDDSDEARDFEILDLEEKPSANGFELSLYGVFDGDPEKDSVEMKIAYSSSQVMFNELGEVSWFELQ